MPSLADARLDMLGRRPWIAKLAKYSAASLAGVVTSTSTLFLMLEVFDVAPVPANITAVTVGAEIGRVHV